MGMQGLFVRALVSCYTGPCRMSGSARCIDLTRRRTSFARGREDIVPTIQVSGELFRVCPYIWFGANKLMEDTRCHGSNMLALNF